MTTLRVSGLQKRFGGVLAVDDVSLDLAEGELHAVIGPNGAGKTTLIHLLSGALTPSAGTIMPSWSWKLSSRCRNTPVKFT